MKLIYSMRKRNSQISISNFKFNFNRKILKMCTSKFFPCSVYTYVCVLIHRNAHVPHIFTKFKWKYFCPLFFPHIWHHIFKNVNNSIIKNNITFIPSLILWFFILSSSLLCPLSINRPNSPCTSTDVMPTECCWHHIKDTSGLQQHKWQENQAQISPGKLKTGCICSYGPDEDIHTTV